MTVGRLARAAAIVALFGLLSRLLGFAREVVLAAAYGASGATDAFVNSLLIVNTVAAILLYTLVTLIIPVFQRERADGGADSAWRLVCALAVWVGAGLVVLAVVRGDLAAGAGRPLPAGPDPRRGHRRADPHHVAGPRPPGLLGDLHGDAPDPRPLRRAGGGRASRSTSGSSPGSPSGRTRSASRPRRGAWPSARRCRWCCSCPSSARLLRDAGVRPALTHPRLGGVAAAGAPGARRVGAAAGQQLHRQALRLEPRGRPGRGAELRERARPGPARGPPAAADDAALPAHRAADVRAARGGGARRPSAASPACSACWRSRCRSCSPIYADEVAQLAFQRQACGERCVAQISPPLVYYALGPLAGVPVAAPQPRPCRPRTSARHPLDHRRHGRADDRARPRSCSGRWSSPASRWRPPSACS